MDSSGESWRYQFGQIEIGSKDRVDRVNIVGCSSSVIVNENCELTAFNYDSANIMGFRSMRK